jgi:Rieske 2Fe-2S family protein
VPEKAGVAEETGTAGETAGAETGRSGDGGVPLQRSLPGRSYTSEAEFARERDQVLLPGWFCVGRADGLTEPGCYLAADVCGESIIVTRTEDGGLAGYYNLCRHRGSRLVPRPIACDPAAGPPTGQPAVGPPPGGQSVAGRLGGQSVAGPLPGGQPAVGPPPGGQAVAGPLADGPVASGRFPGAVRCPYHAWTYGLDGTLRAAPFLPGLRKHRAALSLHRVDVATWGGFVFARLEPPAAPGPADPLEAALGEIPARVAAYPLADLRTGARLRYDVAANWKVILENYNECYHCGPVHPELCELVPAFGRGGGDLDWAAGIPHRSGATTFTSTGTTRRAPFPGLSEAERTRHFGELVLPNLMLSLAADHVAAFTLWPRSAGQTTVLCDFLFHPAELARPDFDPSDAAGFWDLVNRQDWSICEQVQDGMGSRRFSVGYLAPMEQPSADIGQYVTARLDTSGPPGEPGS